MSEVDLKEFELGNMLGIGASGVVYLIKEKATKNCYAAKIMKENKDQHTQEHKILSKIECPSVLTLKGFSTTDFSGNPNPVYITNYMSGGSLHDILSEVKLSGTQKHILLLGISYGMMYLHSQRIVHRDLKPANIFLSEKYYYPYIGDFGTSTISNKTLSQFSMKSTGGTFQYLAPEIFKGEGYKYKADVYSFAITAYEIITNTQLCMNQLEILTNIQLGKRPDLSSISDERLKSLIKRCWSDDPAERPKFIDIHNEFKDLHYYEFFNSDKSQVQYYLNLIELATKAENGDLKAMIDYAYILKCGYGVQRDHPKAIIYLKRAIDKGSAVAMYYYGKLLKYGDGVAEDSDKAYQYFEEAAKKGYPPAMVRMDRDFEKDKETRIRFYECANRCYEIAAGRGDVYSIYKHAHYLMNKNKKEALRYYKMAADRGLRGAMINYARYLEKGEITEKNLQEAKRYREMAASPQYCFDMFRYGSTLEDGGGFFT